jgi:hypothetical protein
MIPCTVCPRFLTLGMAYFSSCRKGNEDLDLLEITADYGVLIRKRKSTATTSFNVKRKYEYDFLHWMLPPTAMISGPFLISVDEIHHFELPYGCKSPSPCQPLNQFRLY